MLNMTRLSRADAGVYTCEAVNSQGAATINITVSVHCEYLLSHFGGSVGFLRDVQFNVFSEGYFTAWNWIVF